MRVLFTKTDTPYQAGTEYDLPADQAKKFVRHGVAKLVGRDAEIAEVMPKPKKVSKKR